MCCVLTVHVCRDGSLSVDFCQWSSETFSSLMNSTVWPSRFGWASTCSASMAGIGTI